MTQPLRIGTRGSKLALWQANWVAGELKKIHSGLSVTLVPIKTSGDLMPDAPLSQAGGKDLFMKEIENELLAGTIDLAVHSMKDVPTRLPEGLAIGAILKREDPRDALVSTKGKLADMPAGSHVGTSSLRRICQLKRIRPDLKYVEMRGNVDTRLEKLKRGQYDAIVLAYAGLKRLGLEKEVTELLEIVPPPGQGAVGVEIRKADAKTARLIAPLNHAETRRCVDAERAYLDRMQGNCQIPLGCLVTGNEDRYEIRACLADLDGLLIERRLNASGGEAENAARKAADEILESGGEEILKRLQHD